MEKQSTNGRTKRGTGGYSNITVKKETATRFRNYSKRFNKSHSEVLDGMVQYFKENQLDPFGEGTKIILDSIKKLERQMMKNSIESSPLSRTWKRPVSGPPMK